jgi:large subunit ribosomal protein L40e
MEVFIVGHDGYAFTALNAEGSDTIVEVNQKLAAINFADSFDYLYVDGRKLEPGESLDSRGVAAGTFIVIGFTIPVVYVSGKTRYVDVEFCELVDHVKDNIEDLEGTPAETQELWCFGGLLKNGKRLSDYDIKKGNTITLIIRCQCPQLRAERRRD